MMDQTSFVLAGVNQKPGSIKNIAPLSTAGLKFKACKIALLV